MSKGRVPDDVRLEHIDGHWTVFVVKDGETVQQTFETEEFANSFADGQRARLGIPISPSSTHDGAG